MSSLSLFMRLADACNVDVMVFSSVIWKTLLENIVVGIRRFLKMILNTEENCCVTVDMTVVVNTVVSGSFLIELSLILRSLFQLDTEGR